MQMNPLGRTGIQVSRICLGTMTFGSQNTEADGHRQMDLAADHGVNFFDTAEMYSFPASAKTQGESERIVGTWMKARGNRDKAVIATKITGPGMRFDHIRGGVLNFSPKQVAEAVDLSLKRLDADYIDLYQTHWPERPANYFGRRGYTHGDDGEWTPFEEVLEGLDRQVKAGKIRAFGVSNETPWGLSKQLDIAERTGLVRAASIQNPYNLLCRLFEVGLAEVSIREECGLLAYSPLGFGALTGKYLDGTPPGSRRALYPEYARFFKPRSVEATRKYAALARENGLEPAQMALAFVNSRQFLTSNIIGATTEKQLETNLSSEDIVLSEEILQAIEQIHADNPNPSP